MSARMKFVLLAAPVAMVGAAFAGQAVGNRCYDFLPVWHSCVGSVSLEDGTGYEGDFVWNVPTGQGDLTRADGSRYSGAVIDGIPVGTG